METGRPQFSPPGKKGMLLFAWGMTDKGVSRQQNQDSFHLEVHHESEQAVCVICDGMGGARAGNIASELAVGVFVEEMRLALKPGMSQRSMRAALRAAVRAANEKVYEKSRPGSEYAGMGTTLVGSVVTPGLAVVANVGDSRAYIIDREGIERVTRDHSLVEDLLARGELSHEEAKNHPSRNLITRALGTDEDVHCDIYIIDMRPGDYLLLCSDGLTNTVEDQEILYEVLHGGDPALCCRRLTDLANSRGGPDNITIILVSL